MDYVFVIQALIIFILCYFFLGHTLPKIKKYSYKRFLINITAQVIYYIQHKLVIEKEDIDSYDKYQLWHYIEKRKMIVQH